MMRAFAAVEEKRLRLDAPVTLTAADKVGGSGTIQKQLEPGPVTLSVRELLRAMIEASDNTATNKVIALLGMDSINASIQRLGLKETRLQRVMMDAAAARAGRENLSTPMELARLLEKIYRREAARSAEMIEFLKLVRGDIRKNIPAPIPVAAKTGELTGVANEAAIVFLERRPYILSVMTVFQPEGTSVIPEVTKLVHGYFQSLAASNAYGNRVFE
jgi:beta-lactamase class A